MEVESAKGTRCLELSHVIEQVLGEDSQLLKRQFYRGIDIKQKIDIKYQTPFPNGIRK